MAKQEFNKQAVLNLILFQIAHEGLDFFDNHSADDVSIVFDRDALTPLYQSEDIEGLIDLVVDAGGDLSIKNSSASGFNMTPLHVAYLHADGEDSARGAERIIEKFEERGANPNAREMHGETPEGVRDYMRKNEESLKKMNEEMKPSDDNKPTLQ